MVITGQVLLIIKQKIVCLYCHFLAHRIWTCVKGGYKADLIEGCVFGRLISDLEFVSVSSPTTLERERECAAVSSYNLSVF